MRGENNDLVQSQWSHRKELATSKIQKKDKDISDALSKHQMYLESQRNLYLK